MVRDSDKVWPPGIGGAFLFLLLAGIFLIFSVDAARGDQLRIIDQIGLSRANKVIGDSARVMVRISGGKREESKRVACRLVDSEGLAADHQGEWSSAGLVVFNDITPGTWRIEVADSSLAVESVRIE